MRLSCPSTTISGRLWRNCGRSRRRAGGAAVPPGGTLRPGMRDTRVQALRARLAASGDLRPQASAEPDLFDEALEAAVTGFQTRHGLEPDGAVGRRTLQALNVQVARAHRAGPRQPRAAALGSAGPEARLPAGGHRRVLRPSLPGRTASPGPRGWWWAASTARPPPSVPRCDRSSSIQRGSCLPPSCARTCCLGSSTTAAISRPTRCTCATPPGVRSIRRQSPGSGTAPAAFRIASFRTRARRTRSERSSSTCPTGMAYTCTIRPRSSCSSGRSARSARAASVSRSRTSWQSSCSTMPSTGGRRRCALRSRPARPAPCR